MTNEVSEGEEPARRVVWASSEGITVLTIEGRLTTVRSATIDALLGEVPPEEPKRLRRRRPRLT